jgi:hypothetical protein
MKNTTRKKRGRAARTYWLTPKVWHMGCSHCPRTTGAVAYRVHDNKRACSACVERLGINAQESRAWHDGGGRAGGQVTVRFVDPATMREAA